MPQEEDSNQALFGSAVSGTCGETCVQFYIYAVCLSATIFFYLLTGTPRSNVVLRCVPQRLRAYSSALNVCISRVLGSIPGALFFGLMLDNACVLWNEECGVRGRCYHYDRFQAAISVVAYGVAMKLIAIVCFIGALVTYKPSREVKENDHEQDEK